jgi:hypothetical protein
MSGQCENLQMDRNVGTYWEKQFASLALERGFTFTTHQIGKNSSAVAECPRSGSPHILTLPDVTIWTAPGQHHEIKHKIPTRYGSYGLEVYRFNALLWFWKETGQSVYYTIHDYSWCGDKQNQECRIEDWRTASVEKLRGRQKLTKYGDSYVNGNRKTVEIHYWDMNLFRPLNDLWLYISKTAA